MQKSSKLLTFIFVGSTVLLQGCAADSIEIPKEELYARNFIKEFGVIQPGNPFNIATRCGVRVITSQPTDVKISAKVSGGEYLFADYTGVTGSTDIFFDIPGGTKDIFIIANNEKIPAKIGDTVDLRGTTSRTLNSGEHGSNPTVTITELTGEHSALTFDKKEARAFADVLHEEGDGYQKYEGTNFGVVTQNFMAEAKEFYIFPQYWHTSQYKVNKIGIYYYVSAGTEGAEAVTSSKLVKTTNAAGEEVTEVKTETKYIKKVEIFDGKIEQLKRCERARVTIKRLAHDMSEEISNDDIDQWIAGLISKYPEKYKFMDTEGVKYNWRDIPIGTPVGYCEALDAKWQPLNDENAFGNLMANTDIVKDLTSLFPSELEYIVESWGGYLAYYYPKNPTVVPDNIETCTKDELDGTNFMSTGVHIEFSEKTDFGFYLTHNGSTMYSEAALNPVIHIEKGGEIIDFQSCYVATYKKGEDTAGNEKRYLCFEDWFCEDNRQRDSMADVNFDLNDMVFRVYGFDKFRSDLPDKPEDPGKIIDEDKPTPETPERYEWIIAAEDLGNTYDFDFNDMVVSVSYVATNDESKKEIRVRPLAAGGIYPVYLMFEDLITKKNQMVGKELHQWFGNPTNQSTNAGVNGEEFAMVGDEAVIEWTGPGDFSLAGYAHQTAWGQEFTNMGGFWLLVDKDRKYANASAADFEDAKNADGSQAVIPNLVQGETYAPQMICVGIDWCWPKEGSHINNHAYSGFSEWLDCPIDKDGKKGVYDTWYGDNMQSRFTHDKNHTVNRPSMNK